jgi:hypothetical protein
MKVLARKKDPARLRWTDVKKLGKARGREFVAFDGAEYQMDRHRLSEFEVAEPVHEGEIRIATRDSRIEEGLTFESTTTWRGRQVAKGTREAWSATRQRSTDPTPRPIDRLAGLPALAGTKEKVIATGGTQLGVPALPVPAGTVFDVPAELFRARSHYYPATPGPRGPAAILTHLKGKGIGLRLTPAGKLLVTGAQGRIAPIYRDAIKAAERLLIANLAGTPLRCELEHKGEAPEAVTLLEIDIASCEEHAR